MSVIAQLFVESSMSGQNQNKGQTTQLSLVESPAGHIILKKLICNDKDRIEQGLDGEISFQEFFTLYILLLSFLIKRSVSCHLFHFFF